MKKFFRYLSIFPALFMLFIIFGFSAQDGATSGSLSYRVCLSLLSFFDRIFSLNVPASTFSACAESMQLWVRKAAHVTEYFLLTLSIFLPLRVWIQGKSIKRPRTCFLSRYIIPTFLLSVLFASLDEFHQTFVPGRCGTPVDVLVDSIGIITGCILLTLCHRHTRKKHDRLNHS